MVKLSNLSIFSAMNNLVDLSMDKEFAGAFGYTDEELDEYFGEGIDEYLEANHGVYESREEFRGKIGFIILYQLVSSFIKNAHSAITGIKQEIHHLLLN